MLSHHTLNALNTVAEPALLSNLLQSCLDSAGWLGVIPDALRGMQTELNNGQALQEMTVNAANDRIDIAVNNFRTTLENFRDDSTQVVANNNLLNEKYQKEIELLMAEKKTIEEDDNYDTMGFPAAAVEMLRAKDVKITQLEGDILELEKKIDVLEKENERLRRNLHREQVTVNRLGGRLTELLAIRGEEPIDFTNFFSDDVTEEETDQPVVMELTQLGGGADEMDDSDEED